MKRAVVVGVLLACLLPTALVHATTAPLPARDDATVAAPGSYNVGIFHPAIYGFKRAQLELHPLVFFVAPHATLKIAHGSAGAWHVAGTYGLAMPWLAQKLLQGYLFPSFKRDTGSLGFVLVPSVGFLLSHATASRVITGKWDLSVGVPLSHSDLRPLEAPAPLEILFAPVLNQYRMRLGALWDASLSARFRMRGYADAFVHGVDPDREVRLSDHVTLRAGAGVDFAVSAHVRAVVGVVVWNSYQFAVDARGAPIRSTDLLPSIDLFWSRP